MALESSLHQNDRPLNSAPAAGFTSQPVSSSDRTSEPEKAAPTPQHAIPVSPEEKLVADIRNSLSNSNRGRERISVAVVKGIVKVQFAINDNLTESMIKGGTQMDVVKILKAAIDSRSDFREIRIVGTFPLVDVYGNSQESRILDVTYSRITLDRVNWKNFLRENIYKIADRQLKIP